MHLAHCDYCFPIIFESVRPIDINVGPTVDSSLTSHKSSVVELPSSCMKSVKQGTLGIVSCTFALHLSYGNDALGHRHIRNDRQLWLVSKAQGAI